ncbi:hypothetical protein [Streptomyces albidochromogenes]|uniref:Uncharacterized protein n=1 Tax=Streptomyces albidochromogenes TaxID=329524 RepID=A0ABW6FKC5_9ACTN
MLRSVMTGLPAGRLSRGRRERGGHGLGSAPHAAPDGGASGAPVRLPVPSGFATPLGCDAVGLPARHGFRTMAHLSRPGCVFADADWWWWIVPAESDLGLAWPQPARYVSGAYVPTRPRLIHLPEASAPYTPPIPLYLMVCRVAGTAPAWSTVPHQGS